MAKNHQKTAGARWTPSLAPPESMASGWGETGAEGEWDNCMRRILEKTKTGDGMGTKWRG